MFSSLLKPFLSLEASPPEPTPGDVAVFRNEFIPTVVGLLSGMGGPADAVTVGDAIICHPRAQLTPRLLRHELQHVRQWKADPFWFPMSYAWNQLKYGYDL